MGFELTNLVVTGTDCTGSLTKSMVCSFTCVKLNFSRYTNSSAILIPTTFVLVNILSYIALDHLRRLFLFFVK